MRYPLRLWFCGLLLVVCSCINGWAQGDVLLSLKPTISGEECLLGETVQLASGDSLRIDVFKVYLGDIALGSIGDTAADASIRYHLFDAAQRASLSTRLSQTGKDQLLHLRFGVDSLTNDLGVHEGDLDPGMGMYWAWQSGYINFKLEGWSSLTAFAKTNGAFTYHVGGFLGAHKASFSFELPVADLNEKTKSIALLFAIDAFVHDAVGLNINSLMRPGLEAVALANLFAKNVRLLP